MQLFYTENIVGQQAILDVEETKHLQVLRKTVGEEIHLVNGKGGLFTARIEALNKRETLLHILEEENTPPPNRSLHIAMAPPKNINRFEWFLEKATEIGIQEITPLIVARSERRKLRSDRLKKILLSAMKQANRRYLPKLNELTTFDTFISSERWQHPELVKYMGHCEAGDKVKIWDNYEAEKDVLVLIGPEGDFAPSEIEQAQQLGFQGIDLGNVRLRTETAGIVVAHTIQLKMSLG